MDRIRVNSLQMAVAAFFAMMAALMLITPHVFRVLDEVPAEQHLFLWGMLFLVTALGLCLAVIAPLPFRLASLLNLAAAALLIVLAVGFLPSELWINSLSYAMLALGLAAAAFINAHRSRRHTNVRVDLLALVVGSGSILTGIAMLISIQPTDFPPPGPPSSLRGWEPVFFLLTGVLLTAVTVLKFRQTSPVGRLGRILSQAAPLFSAGFFFALLFLEILPARSWILAAYYGIFGLALTFLPWFGVSLDRIFPASLRTRLAFVLSVAMAVPLILTMALTSNREEQLVKAEVLSRQQSQAVALANGIADYVNLNRSALVALAGQPGLMSESPPEQRQQLKSFIHAFPDIAYFSTFDTAGNLIATYDNDRDALTYDPRMLVEGGAADNAQNKSRQPRPLFGFGVPTHDANGDYNGLASFGLSSIRVADFLKEQASALEGEIYLVDMQGKVISHPSALMTASFADLSQQPAVRSMLDNPNPSGSVAYSTKDGEQLAGYARVPELNWGVVVERPSSKALAGVFAGREIAFILLMISLVATSASGTLLAGWLISPLEALSKAMVSLSSGQGSPPLPKTSFVEMQRLAIAFGKMRSALDLQTRRREQTLQELQLAKESLETRVIERTSALRMVNLELKRELENRDRLEEALIEKNQRITDILDSISDGFISLDKEWKIAYTNRRATPAGMTQEEIIGKNVWKVFPEFEAIATETGYMRSDTSEIPEVLEIHNKPLNRWYNVRAFPVKEGLSIYWVDVTDSKRTEIERERHQARARQLIEISTKILSINTIEGLLQTLVDAARSLTSTQFAIIGYGYDGDLFRRGAVSSDMPFPVSSPIQIGHIFQLNRDSAHYNLIKKNTSLRLNREELESYPDWIAGPPGHPQINNLAGARLVGRDGRAVGVLIAANKDRDDFTEEDEAELVQLATQASLQLQNVEARQEAERLAEELETIFNAMSDAITVYDQNGAAVRWNPAAAQFTNGNGKRNQAELTRSLKARRTGSLSLITTEEMVSNRALHGEEVHGERFIFTNHSGKDVTVLASASPLHNAEGRLIGAVSIWHDITEIEAAEEALRNSERRMRAVLDYLPVGVWLTDNQGSIIFNNPAAQNIWDGPEFSGIEKSRAHKGWWADSGKPIRAEDWAISRAIKNGETSLNETIEIECSDGSRKIIRNSVVPFFDDHHRLLGVVVLNEDITEYQKTLEALRASEVRLRRLVESTLIAVNYSEENGTVSEANEAYLRMLGFNHRDLLNGLLNWRKVTPPEYLHLDEMALGEAEERGYCTPYEKEYLRKDGSRVPVLIGFARVEGNSGDYVCFMVDLTERKQSEKALHEYMAQLERSNQDLEDFAFIASHDLQEPLRKVNAFSNLLLENYGDTLRKEGCDYIKRMQDAATRMKTMLEGLLEYSRISTKALPFSAVDLNKIVGEVLADLEVSIEQNQGQVTVDTLPVIYGDPLQMRQLLQNLLSNALKFHRPDTPPQVHVYAQSASPFDLYQENLAEAMVQLYVQDNGIGFEDQHINRIFHPFQRLQGRSEFEGSGIGLAICRKIAERHRGWITARSAPGQGSTFIIGLPANPSGGSEES